MAEIKLFSGMDFSGKSTIVSYLDKTFPRMFQCQQKFLTSIQTLQYMIDNDIWIPRNEFIPLLQNMVISDINNYKKRGLILQDTIWVIKFIAKLMADGKNIYAKEIEELLNLVKCYPEMDSFYITATMEERNKRYEIRKSRGERISKSDKLLFSSNMFVEVERYYRDIIFTFFPNTRIIDTTYQFPEEIVKHLKNDRIFMSDLEEEYHGT